jgi:hypothetical protein
MYYTTTLLDAIAGKCHSTQSSLSYSMSTASSAIQTLLPKLQGDLHMIAGYDIALHEWILRNWHLISVLLVWYNHTPSNCAGAIYPVGNKCSDSSPCTQRFAWMEFFEALVQELLTELVCSPTQCAECGASAATATDHRFISNEGRTEMSLLDFNLTPKGPCRCPDSWEPTLFLMGVSTITIVTHGESAQPPLPGLRGLQETKERTEILKQEGQQYSRAKLHQ